MIADEWPDCASSAEMLRLLVSPLTTRPPAVMCHCGWLKRGHQPFFLCVGGGKELNPLESSTVRL